MTLTISQCTGDSYESIQKAYGILATKASLWVVHKANYPPNDILHSKIAAAVVPLSLLYTDQQVDLQF